MMIVMRGVWLPLILGLWKGEGVKMRGWTGQMRNNEAGRGEGSWMTAACELMRAYTSVYNVCA